MMKLFLFLILIFSIFVSVAFAEDAKCQNCDCPITHAPVCGSSGRTFENECLAICFGDKVSHAGSCVNPKCEQKPVIPQVRRTCKYVQTSPNSQRQRCCSWTLSCPDGVCTKSNHKCHWVGKQVSITPVTKCYWARRSQSVRQRRCCTFTRKCIGSRCRKSSAVCSYIGSRYSEKFIGGCQYARFENGVRQRCCQLVKACHEAGQKCTTHSKKCWWKGPKLTSFIKSQCQNASIGHNCVHRKCCILTETCQNDKCTKKVGDCKFVGHPICHEARRRCHFKKEKAGCRRNYCCTVHRTCKDGHCSKTETDCSFKGVSVCTTRHRRCSYKRRANNVFQLRCVTFTKRCNGSLCDVYDRRVKWIGDKIETVSVKGCRWKRTGANSRRKQCCTAKRTCKGKKACQIHSKSCSYTGSEITETFNMQCSFQAFGLHGIRKYCCTGIKRCVDGGNCNVVGQTCRYVGEVVTRTPQKACHVKRYHGKDSRRQQCCSWIKHCYGNNICKNVKRTCSWIGPVIRTRQGCRCKWVSTPKGKRRRCCCSTKVCKGKYCTVKNEKCKFIGKTLIVKVGKQCQWRPYGQAGRRRRCCSTVRKCHSQGKCQTKRYNCFWYGSAIRTLYFIRCRYRKRSYGLRKVCCKHLKHCIGSFCQTNKLKCVATGSKITKRSVSRVKTVKVLGGTRKQRCTQIVTCHGTKKCTHSRPKCRFITEVTRVQRKCSCHWIRETNGDQKKQCCCFRRSCAGIRCKDSKKRCYFEGPKLSSQWDHRCQLRKFKGGIRKYCCHFHKSCQGDFCKTTKSRCRWRGSFSKFSVSRKCSIKKTGLNTTQKTCCTYHKTCINGFCDVKKTSCVKGTPVTSVPVTKCKTVFSKNKTCRRTHCCKFKKICEQGKTNKCSLSKQECFWRGFATCYRSKCSCKWAHSGNCHQQRCCCVRKRCYGGQCRQVSQSCKSQGKKFCNKNHSKCQWKTTGGITRKYCCQHSKTCAKGKCTTTPLGCHWVGPGISSRTSETCSWVTVDGSNERKRCCTVVKRCEDFNCRKVSKRCRFVGKPQQIGCITKITRTCLRPKDTNPKGPGNVCYSQGEPHYHLFNGKSFNNFERGDFIVVSSPHFIVHARNEPWKTGTITSNYGVQAGNSTVETISSAHYKINGKLIRLSIGQSFETPDLFVKRNSGFSTIIQNKDNDYIRIYFFTSNGKSTPLSQYLNAKIRLGNVVGAKGLCTGEVMKAHGIFSNPYDPKNVEPAKKHFTEVQKEFARNICQHRGVPDKDMAACIEQFLQIGSADVVKNFEKLPEEGKADDLDWSMKNKKFTVAQQLHKILLKRPVHHCELFADPHARGFYGKTFEAQAIGDWVIYKGKRFTASYRGVSQGAYAASIDYIVNLNSGIVVKSAGANSAYSVNGKVYTADGLQNLGDGVTVSKAGNKVTVAAKGEEIDFEQLGDVFNIYVRSSRLKVGGLCAHKFQQSGEFTLPLKAELIKPKTPPCPKKVAFKRFCARRKLGPAHMKQCVHDLCSGVSRFHEDEFIKRGFTDAKPKPLKHPQSSKSINRKPVKHCQLFSNAHGQDFKGRNMEVQAVGDWLIYKGHNFHASYRGSQEGEWTGATEFIVHFKTGDVVRSAGVNGAFSINGKVFQEDGRHQVTDDVTVTKTGSKVTIAAKGEEIDFIQHGMFYNIYVRSSRERVSGLCSHFWIPSKDFKHPQVGRRVTLPKPDCWNRSHFKAHCNKLKLGMAHRNECVEDLCAGLSLEKEKEIIKEVHMHRNMKIQKFQRR